jgi:hypothetical protein
MNHIPIKVKLFSATDAVVRACDRYWSRNTGALDTITEDVALVHELYDMASSQVAALTSEGVMLQDDLETLMEEDYTGLTGRKRIGCASKELWQPMGHKRVMYVFPSISSDDIVAVHKDDFNVIVNELTHAITANAIRTAPRQPRAYKPIYRTSKVLVAQPAKRTKRSK